MGHLKAKVYHKGCHNHPNLQKDFSLGLNLVGKSSIFNAIDYKVNCNDTKLISNKCLSSYGYPKIL
jgi:hypothetical protein